MQNETTKLTIRLPKQEVLFVKEYARAHGLTVTEVIDRYLRRIRSLETRSPAPELDIIIGLLPSEANLDNDYLNHLLDKHK